MDSSPPLVIKKSPRVWVLEGELTLGSGQGIRQEIESAERVVGPDALELSGVTALDTVGAMWLVELRRRLEERGGRLAYRGLQPGHRSLLEKVEESLREERKEDAAPGGDSLLVALGKKAFAVGERGYEILNLLGAVVWSFGEIAVGVRAFRFNSFVRHIREAGLQAVPIVALITFLMSIVIAYQGVAQLSMFGAQSFTINLVAVSSLRELGGLLAAIMVAGRSGSSFTSEIGVMKIREEVDAMTVMGMSPLDVMILPRIAALMVVLPLLTVVSFVASFLGGAVVSILSLGIDFETYVQMFGEAAAGHAHWVGMVKAPVFALFIGIISCLEGLRVSGSAESVGKRTTSSVVQGIFSVLVLDAVFSVFFSKIGW